MPHLKKHYFKQIANPELNSKFKYLEAKINYTIIHFDDGTFHKTSYTLALFEKLFKLNPNFMRIHKSFIINSNAISEINLPENKVELMGKVTLPISRRKKKV